MSIVKGFDLMRDTLNLAVPLRIMEVKTMPAWEREGWIAYLKREADFRRAEQR